MSTLKVNNQFSTQSFQALPSQRAATTRTEHELQDQATVYAKGHTLSSYRVQIRGESTLGLSLRDLGVFFSFSNFYLNNASSVGQMRCHRSNHLFICVFSTQQPMFESMEPKGGTRQVYISPPPSDVLYLIRKTGGVKGQRPTKWDRDICWESILYLSICHWRNWKIWTFPVLSWQWTYLKCAKSYLSSLVYVNTFNHWINVIFIFAAILLCAFNAAQNRSF